MSKDMVSKVIATTAKRARISKPNSPITKTGADVDN